MATPLTSLQPYIEAATDRYLLPQLGEKLIEKLETLANSTEPSQRENLDKWQRLLIITQKTLAPFALMLATHEASINFGDTGHTVSRTDTLAPASDTKIAAYFNSLHERAWLNMELLIRYLELNKAHFADFVSSTDTNSHLITSATSFQDNGFVNIDYSRLTYNALQQMIYTLEETDIKPLLGETLFDKLVSNTETDKPFLMAKAYAQKYIAHKAASILSTQRSNQPIDFRPKLAPMNIGKGEENYYSQQAAFFLSLLTNHITKYATLLGVELEDAALSYNAITNRIFVAEG